MDSTHNGEHNGEIQGEFSFRYQERMHSDQNHEPRGEIEEVELNESRTRRTLGDFIPIYIPTIERGVMTSSTHRKKRFWDFLRARPTNDWFLRSGFIRRRKFRVPFVRKINWSSLIQQFKKWIRSPANVALFIWIVLCTVGILFLGVLMVGILNGVIKSSERRDDWEEVINQILNALFTMMCVYQHPTISHHLVLVVRWRPDDQVAARRIYSKKGYQRPHERNHILFVVLLLHASCFSQYVYCALYWGWSRENRPDWAEYLLLGITTGLPVLSAWYTFYGPLGKITGNEESPDQANVSSQSTESETDVAMYQNRRVVVTAPEWIGGLFDCWDDATVACLSCCCTFCVFGWNTERLGFGNMYVHLFTFVFFCLAPLLIFGITALNVNGEAIKIIVASSGVLCCVLGLLYGGYWRSKIRQKFRLPGNPVCCGYPLMTDFARWLFCCPCSLAQEVRTANFYDIEDDGFYRKVTDEEGRHVLVPLPREDNFKYLAYNRSFSSPPNLEGMDANGHRERTGGCSPMELPISLGRASTYSKVHAMKPPLPPLMQTENEHISQHL